MKKISVLCLLSFLIGCQAQKPAQPVLVPAIEVKKPKSHPLGIIGEVEPIYIPPMKSPFLSRIDTGAENSSMDAKNIKQFERDGEKWVSFTIINRETGEKHRFEKEVVKMAHIKRVEEGEKRYVVFMDVKMGKETINTKFSLADRDKFDYQTLIGRNILSGRALVDVALSNTLQ